MRTWIWLVVFSSVASAAPPPETACQAGDAEACLAVAEKAFGSKQNDLALVTTIGLCEKGEGEGCMRAAHYMERLKISVRAGKTPAQLRERGMKQLETSCTANSGSACFRFGKALYQGKNIATDQKRGQVLLEKGCTLSFAAACVFLASLDRDGATGRAYLEKACNAGDGPGCTGLGDRDKKRAPELYAKACTAEDAAGCARLGGLQRTARQLDKAIASFELSCDLGLDEACADAGALRETGKGIVDLVKAREHYTRACDGKVGAGCLGLALLVATNRGGARNWGQAVELADTACTLQAKGACEAAKKLAARPPDGTCSTVEQCTPLCDEKIAKACVTMGELIAKPGTPEACSDAAYHYTRTCEAGVGGAVCVRAGNSNTSQGAAFDAYEKGCERRDPEACMMSAYVNAVANNAAGYAVLEGACRKKQLDSCFWMARAMRDSEFEKAERHYRDACNKGMARACDLLAASLQNYFVRREDPNGTIGISGDTRDTRTPAERKSDEARAKEAAVVKEKACKLGLPYACGNLYISDGKSTCKPGDIAWDY